MLNRSTILIALALVSLGGAPAAAQYVLIVNPKNPVGRLSSVELSKIYLGKVQAWNMNGQLEQVLPVDLPSSSPVRAQFSQKVLRRSVSEAESYWRQEVFAGRNVPPPEQSEADAIVTVRNEVGAIAYVSANADLKGVKVVSVQ
jgi:ABC-type phosphate transport system substrate-binding protein